MQRLLIHTIRKIRYILFEWKKNYFEFILGLQSVPRHEANARMPECAPGVGMIWDDCKCCRKCAAQKNMVIKFSLFSQFDVKILEMWYDESLWQHERSNMPGNFSSLNSHMSEKFWSKRSVTNCPNFRNKTVTEKESVYRHRVEKHVLFKDVRYFLKLKKSLFLNLSFSLITVKNSCQAARVHTLVSASAVISEFFQLVHENLRQQWVPSNIEENSSIPT